MVSISIYSILFIIDKYQLIGSNAVLVPMVKLLCRMALEQANALQYEYLQSSRSAGEGVLSKAKITVFSALIYLGLHQCHLSNIFNGTEYEYAYTV